MPEASLASASRVTGPLPRETHQKLHPGGAQRHNPLSIRAYYTIHHASKKEAPVSGEDPENQETDRFKEKCLSKSANFNSLLGSVAHSARWPASHSVSPSKFRNLLADAHFTLGATSRCSILRYPLYHNLF